MVISILTRRLREGKTLEDFRAAWHRQRGFGVLTRVVTGQAIDDPLEIVTIGFTDIELDEAEAFLERTAPEEARRHERIAEVIEPGMTRAFYIQVADDDLSEGALPLQGQRARSEEAWSPISRPRSPRPGESRREPGARSVTSEWR